MNIQFRQLIWCIILFVMSMPGQAQNSQQQQDTMRFTLREAQDYALQYNKTIWNAGLSVSEAQKMVWEAISSGLPQVNATLDYQNMMGFKMSLFGQSIPLESTSTFQTSVTQLLFNGSYWVGIRMAKIGEQMTETARLQSELDIREQTQTAYLSVLVALENKKILDQNLRNMEVLAKSTADMVRVGVAEQTDADQLAVQVASIQNGIKTVERHIELAYNLLRFHLGLDMSTGIVLTEGLDNLMSEDEAQKALATDFDLDANYNVQLLDQQVELAKRQINLEQAASLPSIVAVYNYTYKLKKSSFDMTPANVIMMQASIPIFASGQRYVRTQQAKIRLETAQNNRSLLTDQLLMQEKQLRFNLNNAVESYILQRQALEVSQRVLESITRKYQQGVASSLDVTTANTSLLQAQTNYISAIMEVVTAQTNLEKLLNTL